MSSTFGSSPGSTVKNVQNYLCVCFLHEGYNFQNKVILVDSIWYIILFLKPLIFVHKVINEELKSSKVRLIGMAADLIDVENFHG